MTNLKNGSKKETTETVASFKSRKSELKGMDFYSLERLASKRKAGLVFKERGLNEDATSSTCTENSFHQRMKPNQVEPYMIYGSGGKNQNLKEMCHGKSWLRDSHMTDVIEGKFLRHSIEERILKREDSM